MSLAAKPKRHTATAHHKRRAGQHHRHNEHYLRTYWPYLPLLLVVVLGVALNSLWAHKGVLGYATDMSVSELLQDTNNQRDGNGLGGLGLNDQLNAAAQAKANDMAARDYWSHNTPDGTPPWTFITNAGYHYQTAGENLAYGFDTSDYTVTAWMNSPEHRANILNTTYKDVGFGIANAASYQGNGPETIVVAEYGSPEAVAAAPQQTSSRPTATATSTPTTSSASPAQSSPASTPVASPSTPTAPANKPTDTNSTPAPAANAQPAATPAVATKNITRIQLLAGKQAPWSMFAVVTLATVAMAIFIIRHGLAWHRLLVKSERFVLHHKLLDIILIAVAVLGAVLTRTVGIIR